MRNIWLAALVLAVAACGDTTPSTSGPSTSGVPNQGQPVSTPVSTPASSGPTPSPSPVTPKGNTINPHKVRWISAKPSPDGRSLRIVWWSGVEPCNTLDRVEVAEKKDSVTVTLYEGPDRRSPDVACIEIAVQKTTTVTLPTPLDGRRVVDGAA
jgi:hypothetical protein